MPADIPGAEKPGFEGLPLKQRPSWDQYFMDLAEKVAQRSTCLRRQVGAILVRERHILATGYNGAPSKVPHCLNTGCRRQAQGIPSGQRHEMCVGVHAEQNCIIQAALHGSSPAGATLYCTHQPCVLCAKILVNAQIRRVVFQGAYPDALAVEIFRQGGVELFSHTK